MRSLYVTFIRPLLEFAIPVWSPYLKGDCENIERVQHRATKPEISNFQYEDRLIALDLTTLNVRRKKGDLIQLYKFLHGIDKIGINNFPIEKQLRWIIKMNSDVFNLKPSRFSEELKFLEIGQNFQINSTLRKILKFFLTSGVFDKLADVSTLDTFPLTNL